MTSVQEPDLFCGTGAFQTTHWSVVLTAAETSSLTGRSALEQLCAAYWYPLYAYARRQGLTPEEAQDVTQAFFARLLEKRYLAHANRERGRFRTFLLTSLQRFLINERQKLTAEKRGGRSQVLSWDEHETESRYLTEPAAVQTPEMLFERNWAMALLEQVLSQLEAEFSESGKQRQFERLKRLLWGDKAAPSYAEVAAELGMSAGALKVAVHRLRTRYRELLRAEVARTVSSRSEVDEELRHLLAVISR